jgi:hypothetical protein
MATQELVIARFSNDAAVITVEYNDQTNRVTAVSAVVASGSLTVELTRQNGQTRQLTIGPGSSRSTNVPTGMDLGIDPETGELSFTRGNISSRFWWSP